MAVIEYFDRIPLNHADDLALNGFSKAVRNSRTAKKPQDDEKYRGQHGLLTSYSLPLGNGVLVIRFGARATSIEDQIRVLTGGRCGTHGVEGHSARMRDVNAETPRCERGPVFS